MPENNDASNNQTILLRVEETPKCRAWVAEYLKDGWLPDTPTKERKEAWEGFRGESGAVMTAPWFLALRRRVR